MPMDIIRNSFKEQEFACVWYIAEVHFLQRLSNEYHQHSSLWELRVTTKPEKSG